MSNFAEFTIPFNLLLEAAVAAEAALEDLNGSADIDATPLLSQISDSNGMSDELDEGEESNESSSDDDEDESLEDGELEEQDQEIERIVVLEMYNALYKDLDTIKDKISELKAKFENRRAQLYAANFDRRKKKPIPMRLVIDRHQKIAGQLANLDQQVNHAKHHIKAMDRRDSLIFYPDNIRVFREKTYAAFVQPAREIAMPVDCNNSKCICCQEPANVSIHRSCLWCEGHSCSCRQFLMCEKCSIKWYWRSSEGFGKSFATCPLCRAEYCLEDIVIYRFAQPEPQTLDEQIETQKRKLEELENRQLVTRSQTSTQPAKKLKLSDSISID